MIDDEQVVRRSLGKRPEPEPEQDRWRAVLERGAPDREPDPWKEALFPGGTFEEQFARGAAEGGWVGKIPVAGDLADWWKIGEVLVASRAVRAGKGTEEQEQVLLDFLEEAQSPRGTGYYAGSIMANAPTFFVEMLLGGAAWKLAKAGAKKAALKMVAETLEQAAEKTVKRSLKRQAIDAVGEAAFGVSTVLAPMTLQKTVEAQLPDMGLTEDEAGNLSVVFANSGKDFLEALPEGWRGAFAEYFSERSGGLLRGAARAIPRPQKLTAFMARFFGETKLGKRGIEILKKGGWDGLLEEIGEERVNSILTAMFGDTSWADVIPSREQLAGEIIGIAGFGGAIKGTAATASALMGERGQDKSAVGRAERLDAVVSALRGQLDSLDPEEDAEEYAAVQTALERAEAGRSVVMSGLPDEAEAEPVERAVREDPEGLEAADFFQGRNEESGTDFGDAVPQALEPTTEDDLLQQERFDSQDVDLVLLDTGEAELGRPAVYRPAADGRRAQVIVSASVGGRARQRALFLHELLHALYRRAGGSWEAVRDLIEKADPEGLRLTRDEYSRRIGKELPEELLGEEAVSLYVEMLTGWLDNVASDPRSLAESQQGRSLLVRIADAIVELYRKLGGNVRSTEERELARRFEEANLTEYEQQLDAATAFQLARDIQSLVEAATKVESPGTEADTAEETAEAPPAEPPSTAEETAPAAPSAEGAQEAQPVEPAVEPAEPARPGETTKQRRARQRKERKAAKKARQAQEELEARMAPERASREAGEGPTVSRSRREPSPLTAAEEAEILEEEGRYDRFAAAPVERDWDAITRDLGFWEQEAIRSAGLDEGITEAARVAAMGTIARSGGPAKAEEVADTILDRLLQEMGRDAEPRAYFKRAMEIGRELNEEERFAVAPRPQRPFPPPKDSATVKGGAEGNLRRKLSSKERYENIPKGSVDPKDIRGTGAHKLPRKVLRLDPKKLEHVFDPKGAARWVVGKLTPLDWWKRVSSVLSPEEIAEARRWYEKVIGAFEAGDENLIAAWLMANQQVAPWMALMNALRVREYVLSRQEAQGKKLEGGLQRENLKELWTRVRDLVSVEEMDTKGISRKLYDFIDSALGFEDRQWMGQDPLGGEPAVVDVHTSRDVGFVDPTLWGYLEKLGVPRAILDALAKDKADFDMAQVDDGVLTGGAPTALQYERGAEFLHEVRDYLNKRGLGGERWDRVAEVQAVGWMALLKLFKLEADTPEGAVAKNTKTVAAALMFGEGAPYNERFPELAHLPYEAQARVTDRVARVASDVVREALGGWPYLLSAEVGQGTWGLFDPEPAVIFRVMATPEGTDAFADGLGYLLQQTEVRHERALEPTPSGAAPSAANEYFVEIYAHELGTEAVYLEAWRTISRALPNLMAGSHPVVHPDGTPGMRIGVTKYSRRKGETKEAFADRSKGGYPSGKTGLAALEADIDRALEGVQLPVVRRAVLFGQVPKREAIVDGEPQAVNQSRNDWKEDTDGESYLRRLGSAWGPEIPARLRDRGRARVEAELAEALRDELDAERSAAAPRPGTRAAKDAGADPLYAVAPRIGTVEWRDWFRESVVVDAEGRPLVVYHATAAAREFDLPDPNYGELGAHFGTIEQATDIIIRYDIRAPGVPLPAGYRPGAGDKGAMARSDYGFKVLPRSRIFPVFLSIQNPFEAVDIGVWDERVLRQLPLEERERLVELIKSKTDPRWRAENEAQFLDIATFADGFDRKIYLNEWLERASVLVGGPDAVEDAPGSELRAALEFLGYDGVKYVNRYEGVRTGLVWAETQKSQREQLREFAERGDMDYSYIAFRPEQIRSALGQGAEVLEVESVEGDLFAQAPRISGQQHFTSSGAPTLDWRERRVGEWVDILYPLKKLQKTVEAKGGVLDDRIDSYLAHELRRGKTKARLEAFGDTYVRPIVKHIADSKFDMDDVRDYLVARHVFERNAQIEKVTALRKGGPLKNGSGHTDAWAAKTLTRLSGPEWDELGRLFDSMNEWKLDYMLATGLVSSEDVAALRGAYQMWAPLRHMDKGEQGFMGIGRGIDTGGRNFQRAFGRTTPSDHPLEFAVMLAETAIIRGEKNRVGLRILDWVRINEKFLGNVVREDLEVVKKYAGPDGLMRERKDMQHELADNVLRVRENGQVVTLTWNAEHKLIPMALKNYGAADMNSVVQFIAGTTRTLAALSTRWNPAFTPFNALRDLLHTAGVTYADQGFAFMARVIANMPMAYLALAWQGWGKTGAPAEWKQAVTDYAASGAPITFLDLRDVYDVAKDNARAIRRLRAGQLGKLKNLLVDFGLNVGKINDIVENAARLSAFQIARRPPARGGLGFSTARAASYAKNLTTNFERKGLYGQRYLAPYFMFANAGIQGTARVSESFWANKVRMGALLGGIMASGAIWDVVAAIIAGDDDEGRNNYDKIPGYVKRNNIVIPDPDGSGEYTTIPLPFVFNFFWNFGRDAAAMQRGQQTLGETAMSIATSAMDSFNPLGGSEEPAQILWPTIAKPFWQHYANKDYLGRNIKPEQFPFGVEKPNKDLYYPSVSPTAKWATQRLHELAYGKDNPLEQGVWDWSPEIVQHYTEWATGGLGRTLRRGGTIVEKKIVGEEVDWSRELPIYRRFRGTPDPNYDKNQYREVITEVQELEARLKILRETDKDAYQRVREENREVYQLIAPMKASEKRVRALRKRIRESPRPELEEKLQEEYRRFLRRAMKAGVAQ